MRRIALLVALAASCLAESPEEQAADELPPDPTAGGRDDDDDDGSPTHRPGQPCLVCHSERYDEGEELFVLAGTVYRRASDTLGLGGAEVLVEDAAGHAFTARTNAAGNFMVSVHHGTAPEQRGEGEFRIPWPLDFPLHVAVRYGGVEKRMRNVIHREGSCAACHQAEKGAASAGRVFVEEVAP